MLTVAQNPPILLPQAVSLKELAGTWWLAHTKARCEKVFAFDLLHRDIGYFLPMRKKITFSGGRRRHVLQPLFASYVFFCGSGQDRHAALATNRLCQVIEVADQERLITELAAIEKVLAGGVHLDPWPQLAVGAQCRIKSGPMMGIEGVVIEKNVTKAKILLSVSILGQGAVLEVDGDVVELI
jgi:transcription antitermination factor NusG